MSKIKVHAEELTYGVLGPVAREETVAVGEASSEANDRLTAMHPSSLAAFKEAGASSDSPRRGVVVLGETPSAKQQNALALGISQ